MRLAVLAQVVIWAVGVHAFVSSASDMFVAAIANDVGVSSTVSVSETRWVDIVGRPGNLDE